MPFLSFSACCESFVDWKKRTIFRRTVWCWKAAFCNVPKRVQAKVAGEKTIWKNSCFETDELFSAFVDYQGSHSKVEIYGFFFGRYCSFQWQSLKQVMEVFLDCSFWRNMSLKYQKFFFLFGNFDQQEVNAITEHKD